MSILRNRNTEIKYLNRDLGSKKRMHLANIGVGTTQVGRGHWSGYYSGKEGTLDCKLHWIHIIPTNFGYLIEF